MTSRWLLDTSALLALRDAESKRNIEYPNLIAVKVDGSINPRDTDKTTQTSNQQNALLADLERM